MVTSLLNGSVVDIPFMNWMTSIMIRVMRIYTFMYITTYQRYYTKSDQVVDSLPIHRLSYSRPSEIYYVQLWWCCCLIIELVAR